MSRKRLFDIIQIGQREDGQSRAFDLFIVVVILSNTLVTILETFDELASFSGGFGVIEAVTMVIFLVEYGLRLVTADYLYPDLSKGKAVARFIVSFDGIVCLLTILPFFYLSGAVAFRMLRVVRIFHLFRINQTYDSFQVIVGVLVEKKNQLLSSIFIIIVLMLASSLCMYSVEHQAQPEVFRNAFSGIWWSMSTILTVGYGDIYPITTLGQVMAIFISFLGVLAVAVPTGIISAGFVTKYTAAQNEAEQRISGTHTTLIEEGHPFKGLTVKYLEMERGIHVSVCVRNGSVIIPGDQLELRYGDTVVYEEK